MFCDAISFDSDLANWNVSNVIDMNSMFYGATAFNGNLSRWDVSSVADMNSMFDGATSFNGDLSIWDVSSVKDMTYMFRSSISFNQNLCGWKDKFPYDSASDIFVASGCTFQSQPRSDEQGPFCASSSCPRTDKR